MNEDAHSTSRPTVGNDNHPLVNRLLADVVMGWRFYSRLPSGPSEHEKPELSRMAPVLAPVSLLIGLGPALLIVLLATLGMPLLPAVVLGMAALALVTGAMSEDALADSFDGLWGGQSPEQRLDIMHDSTHGTFGVLAIAMLVALRLSLLAALFVGSPIGGLVLWLGAQMLSRQASLWLPFRLPAARTDGAGASAGTLPTANFALGLGVALVLFVIGTGPLIGPLGLVAALMVGAAITLLWARICTAKVGGYTGDLIGGAQALVEVGLLCTFILFV